MLPGHPSPAPRPPPAWCRCRANPDLSRRSPTCTAPRFPSTTPRRIRTPSATSTRGESFEGPPSTAVFAGNGFIYIAPDYLGLGDSTVPRHRYFHAAPRRPPRSTCWRPRRCARRSEGQAERSSSSSASPRADIRRSPCIASWNGCARHVDATAVVGGVFDVEQWFLASLANETTLTRAAVRVVPPARVRRHLRRLRPTADTLPPPYAAIVEDLFDMRHYFDDIAASCRPRARSAEAVVPTRAHHEPRHPIASGCGRTPWIGRAPEAPVRVTTARRRGGRLRRRPGLSIGSGARRGDLRAHLQGFDHVNSWIQAMPRAVRWFRDIGMRRGPATSTRSSCGRWVRPSTPGARPRRPLPAAASPTIRSIRR